MKTKLLFLAAGTACIACACTEESAEPGEGKAVTISVSVTPEMATRVEACPLENLLESFDLYVFDLESKLLENVRSNIPALLPPNDPPSSEHLQGATFFFTDSKPKIVVAVGNRYESRTILPEIIPGTTTYEEMMSAVTNLPTPVPTLLPPFPMWGKAYNVSAADRSVKIEMTRGISKLLVTFLSSGADFKVTEVQLRKTVSRGYLFNPYQTPDGLEYVDYGPKFIDNMEPVAFYVFPQSVLANNMKLDVTGVLGGVEFTKTIDVIPVVGGVPQRIEPNTVYNIKVSVENRRLFVSVEPYKNTEWEEGGDVPGIIVDGHDNVAKDVLFDGKIWMDRNMGAICTDYENDWEHARGDYYQWGCNIPLPVEAEGYAAGNAPSAGPVRSNGSGRIPEWWFDYDDSSRWQTPETQPCPEGYRLPTDEDFISISSSVSFGLGAGQTAPFTRDMTYYGHRYIHQYWLDGKATTYGIVTDPEDAGYVKYFKWELKKTFYGHMYMQVNCWHGNHGLTFEGKTLEEVKASFEAFDEVPEQLIFPASGYITKSSNYPNSYEDSGYYWTSVPRTGDIGSRMMSFSLSDYGMMSVSTSPYREQGQSIRCIRIDGN